MAFSWSKMQTVNEQDTRARIKMTHLCFEDFLEALCRLAVLKALPTLDDLAEAECGDAGTFLLQSASGSPEQHNAFLAARKIAWGRLPGEQGLPVWRKVELLLELIIVLSQGGLDRPDGAGMSLTEAGCKRMLKSKN